MNPSSPEDIRKAGWTVAVHNDYRLNATPHTFWLFTKNGRTVKGEGVTDELALNEARKAIAALPKVVTICGSSRFIDVMAVVGWFLERDERAVVLSLHLLPMWYGAPDHHLAEAEGIAAEMDALHLKKIEMADEVFVVNFNDYIGSSTRNEIEFASKLGKPIRWFTHDTVGDRVLAHIAARQAADAPK